MPQIGGEAHFKARLSNARVAALRASYVRGKVGYGELAKEFSIGVSTVRDIVNGKTRLDAIGCAPEFTEETSQEQLAVERARRNADRAARGELVDPLMAAFFGPRLKANREAA